MNKEKLVIAIPIYKKKLNEFEQISLQQLSRVLWKYPKKFIAPDSLDFDYGLEYSNWEIERFSDSFFKNTDTYSQLLLSKKFYQRLQDYQYLLIYQLDAFVFSDRIEEFCAKGYDYIGAPLPSMVPDWEKLKLCVGNGGLSLRNITQSLVCVKQKEEICSESDFPNRLLTAEDLFFSYCGISSKVKFKVSSRREAEQFSVDFNVRGSYLRIVHNMPFGCHGWYLRNYDFWRPIIEKIGYNLADVKCEIKNVDSTKIRNQFIRRYLSLRILRLPDIMHLKGIVSNILSNKYQYAIWGYGDDGKRCHALLKLAGVNIAVVYDRCFIRRKILDNITYKFPDIIEIQQHYLLIISTSAYETDIASKLEKKGMKKNIDFFLYSDIETEILRLYYADWKW